MFDQPPIDVDRVLTKTRIKKEVFLAMLEQSIPYLNERMDSLRRQLTSGCPYQVAREAHAIKGSAASLGMDAVQQWALKVERLGKGMLEGNLPVDVQRLQAELRRAVQYAGAMGARVECLPTARRISPESY